MSAWNAGYMTEIEYTHGYYYKKDTHFNCLNKQHSLNSCP